MGLGAHVTRRFPKRPSPQLFKKVAHSLASSLGGLAGGPKGVRKGARGGFEQGALSTTPTTPRYRGKSPLPWGGSRGLTISQTTMSDEKRKCHSAFWKRWPTLSPVRPGSAGGAKDDFDMGGGCPRGWRPKPRAKVLSRDFAIFQTTKSSKNGNVTQLLKKVAQFVWCFGRAQTTPIQKLSPAAITSHLNCTFSFYTPNGVGEYV